MEEEEDEEEDDDDDDEMMGVLEVGSDTSLSSELFNAKIIMIHALLMI